MPYQADKQEKEILEFWDRDKTFEKSIKQRPPDKPYVFYDGPPFATGLPHYGHILSSVIKDVVPRYWTMKGYRVRRRWGWDCHGLPIESLIERELKISGKKDIEEKIGVKEFNEACESKVLIYTSEWKEMVERIGRWIEFDNAYKTMDKTYMESVWWAIKKIWDDGNIYEGRKVLMYCPRCETPVSKAEVAMDNSYKDVTEEAVTVKFKVKEGQKIGTNHIKNNTYILAWTTTPWTLPGNVALAVSKDIKYILIKVGDENFIVAQDRREIFGGGETRIGLFSGKELINIEYEPPFDMPAVTETGKRAYYVAAGDFVNTEEGTGVVHTAVIYGEDDYNLGLKLDLPMVPMLDDAGHYTAVAPEFIQGQYYKKAEKEIKKDLESRGLIFDRQQNTHSYPHCWRCETQLIYNAVSSWFINIQKVKERMIELNEKVNWFPEHLKHGRFLNIMKDAPDWNISRNRYWATALPFWRSEDGDVVCVGSIEELEGLSGQKIDNLHKHVVDKITFGLNGKKYIRVPEVLDSWVEAASMPFAEWHYPFENKETVEARMPGQYIAEYIAQTRTWFYYMHAMAVLLFDNISFENVVSTGTILNDKGEKLSKSKRNFTDPWIIIEQYGMDALRYYLMTSVVMQGENLFFQDREVRDVYNKVINITWNVVTFYSLYAGEYDGKTTAQDSNNVLDRWVLSRLSTLIKDTTKQMDNYNTVKAGRPIKEFVDELSTWYLQSSRERFKDSDEEDKQFALATLREVLLNLSKVMATFTPFIAEQMYQSVADKNTSVHLAAWPEANQALIDSELETTMDWVKNFSTFGLNLRKLKGVNVRQPLSKFTIAHDGEPPKYWDECKEILAKRLNVKEVVFKKGSGPDEANFDFEITPELKKEGLARELVRAINQLRKDAGLTRENKAAVEYGTDDKLLESVFTEFGDEIKKQTHTSEFVPGGKTDFELAGAKLKLSLKV